MTREELHRPCLDREVIMSEENACEDKGAENLQDDESLKITESASGEEEKLGGPQFEPRLYLQRYYFVKETLIKHKAEKIVDFGSAECKISRYLAKISTVKEIALVDIDRNTLEMNKWCIRPGTCDFVYKRENPLSIKIFEGSITQYDSKLEDYDAVTMVEIIEHLQPDVLQAAVHMVFEQLEPKIVVMTTPNADFNVLFPGLNGFRHWDHKFEWTRAEFQSWCGDIVQKYDYAVEFSGIGEPQADSRHVGCCSQAAVFIRNYDKFLLDKNVASANLYTLITECSYPYKTTDEDAGDPLLNEIDYQLRQFQADTRYEDYDDNCLVPLSTLLRFKQIKSNLTENQLRDYLRDHGYRITEDGDTIILPALHKTSDSDTDSDSVIDKECVSEIQTVEPVTEGKMVEEIDYWD